MKKACLLSLLILCCSWIYAQLTYGIKAGLNFSHVSSNKITIFPDGSRDVRDQSASNVSIRPLVGIWTNLAISDRLSLRTELQGVQKNWTNNRINFSALIAYEMYYLSLPIQFSYRLRRWDIHLGPELNYLLYLKNNFIFGGFTITGSKLALGTTIGLSYHFPHWFIDLRANRDLNPFFKLKTNNIRSGSSNDIAVYHQGLQLSVGYHVPNFSKRHQFNKPLLQF